jgi:hypothetical protein
MQGLSVCRPTSAIAADVLHNAQNIDPKSVSSHSLISFSGYLMGSKLGTTERAPGYNLEFG